MLGFRLRRASVLAAAVLAPAVTTVRVAAQDADPRPAKPDSLKFPNSFAGEFTPSTGYTIIKTDHGSLNISVYGLFRYMNQMPAGQIFLTHLGKRDSIVSRNDVN
jgi:hypothetical protein